MTVGLWPFGVVLASRWSKSDSELRRALGRGCGGILLYASFNLSILAIWGAVLRAPPGIAMHWTQGLVLLQPVAFALALWVIGEL